MSPLVGIILRTKDRPILLQRALHSILSQSFKNWHISLVNDGGNHEVVEETVRRVEKKLADRITISHNTLSLGMEAASNIAISKLPPVQYLVVHDDDDSWKTGFLESTVAYLENPPSSSVRGVVTHTESVKEKIAQNILKEIKVKPYNTYLRYISLCRILAENTFPPVSFLFQIDVYNEIGPFREDLPVLGDWEFNVRFLCRYEIGVIPRILARYHNRTVKAGPYASSLHSKQDLHIFYDNNIRNEWIRHDLSEGRTGLGFLAQQCRASWEAERNLKRIAKKKFFIFK